MIEKYIDAEELKRLLSVLGVILVCLIIVGLFACIVVPGLRNANKPAAPAAVAPVVRETGWLDPTEFPPQKGVVVPPIDPKTLISATPELMSKGKTLFEADCAPCHGLLGHGDGPAAASMNPQPRNLTSSVGWTNGYDLPDIFKTLIEGIKSTSMASFDYLSKKDRMALAHYVQSLGSFPKRENPEATEALSRSLAAAGEKTPNKIPVSMAMAKLENEFIFVPSLAIDEKDQSPGAQILRRAIMDPACAARVLAQTRMWRASARDLAAAILPNAPGNGFSLSAATMSSSEWQMLYSELLNRIKTK
jgi:mono/diheme cytochrome c family protein